MDSDKEWKNLFGIQENSHLPQMLNFTHSLKYNNECEARKELKVVNKFMLTNTMKEWSTTVDDQITANGSNDKEIEISKPGENNSWYKEYLLKEKSLGGDIMRILYSEKIP